MKFDKLLATFLYEQKRLPMPNMGELVLDEKFTLPQNINLGSFYPQEGIISFKYDRKTTISEELQSFLKKEISKPLSLIISDLEEYILQIENWLNIGKPYTIEGIGTFSKLKNGTIDFSTGISKAENISDIVNSLNKKESDYRAIVFNQPIKKKKLLKALIGLVSLCVLCTALWFAIPYIKKAIAEIKQKQSPPPVQVNNIKTDTLAKPIVNLDTPKVEKPLNDTIRYKMYFLATKYKEKADKLYYLWSKDTKVNRDSAIVNDTLRYRLYIYKKAIPADTAKVKQRLEAYFKHSILIVAAQ